MARALPCTPAGAVGYGADRTRSHRRPHRAGARPAGGAGAVPLGAARVGTRDARAVTHAARIDLVVAAGILTSRLSISPYVQWQPGWSLVGACSLAIT